MDATDPDALPRVLSRLAKDFDEHLAQLTEFLRIPSVSAQPDHGADVEAAGRWLADRLRRAGFDDVQTIPTSGHAAVTAVWDGAGIDAPTLLAYGHYDVQPASMEDGWRNDPFEPVIEGDRIWGRGTTDDKGQLMCHVLAAEAWFKETGGLPINLRLVFEGEEEVGSTHFDEVIDAAEERLRADLLVVSDTPMLDEDTPGLTLSLRGIVTLQVDVTGPSADLHSGTWGGVVWNPLEALSHMLASLKDPVRAKVLVPGFYDPVQEPSAALREALPVLDDAFVMDGTGSGAVFGEEGWSNVERIGIRPTLEINGIWGGYTGDGMKTVIPSTAHAKVSARIVPDQAPEQVMAAIEAHLQAVAPPGIQVTVTGLGSGDPVAADPEHPLVATARQALADTWPNEPVVLAEGGSIPAVADMQKRLGAVPVLAGFGNKDENMHGPDESFRLSSFRRGREAMARLLAGLASVQT